MSIDSIQFRKMKRQDLEPFLTNLLASRDAKDVRRALDIIAELEFKPFYDKIPPLYWVWTWALTAADADYEVRTRCVSLMGAFAIGEDEILLHAANVKPPPTPNNPDPANHLHMFAILWLVERKNSAAAGLAQYALDHEKAPGVRATMASLLARAAPENAVGILRQKLDSGEPDPATVAKYLSSFYDAGGKAVADEVLRRLTQATGQLLHYMGYDLGITHHSLAMPILLQALQAHKVPEDRRSIITNLAMFAAEKEKNALIPLIVISDETEAEFVLRALAPCEEVDLFTLENTAQFRSPRLGDLARQLIASAAQDRAEWRER